MGQGHTPDSTVPFIYDIIIVGAGPCGLAVAARLREPTPSSLFTDEEHHRYHWINRHAAQASIKNAKTGKERCSKSTASTRHDPSILVLDESGTEWMTKWDRLFRDLEISHLRSPMFFHPDPHDRDGLLAYAHAHGRQDECVEIAGCVGKEISKHQMKKARRKRAGQDSAKPSVTIDERDRKDYFAPSSGLFRDYCRWIAKRYSLCGQDLIQKASVRDIEFDYVKELSPDEKLFTVRTDNNSLYARSVVLAVGAGSKPSIPSPFPHQEAPCACHAFEKGRIMLHSCQRAQKPPETRNILVVGGGLTSAQISDQAVRQGSSKVWHLMRGPMKVKPFDVDLNWMGKFRNHEKATFWSADSDEERAELIKTARGGGSITPRFAKVLQKHAASRKLVLCPGTTIIRVRFSTEHQTWSVETEPPSNDLPSFHHVYFATGSRSDCVTLPLLRTMNEKYPVECYDGLPALTDDLMWKADVPLFMTGKLAGLRLGPGAGNLEGARAGAERIAWAIGDLLSKEETTGSGGGTRKDSGAELQMEEYRYRAGLGSRFESLAIDA